MKFDYQARTKDGNLRTGTIEASSKEAGAALLQKYNLYVVSLKEIKFSSISFKKTRFYQKITGKDLAIFSRQLAVMLDSRVPVIQSLLSLASQTTKTDFKEKIIKISELIEEGNSLSDAFSFFPKIFDIFYISMLKSGETSGKIADSLYYLSNHLEREYNLAARLKMAMIYPVLVLFVLLAVIIVIIVVVVPPFTEMLKEAGAEVPLITKVVLWIFNFLKNFGWIIITAFVGLITFVIYYLRTKEGKKIYDRFSIKLPLIGGFLQKVFLTRFAENMSTLLSAGLSVNQALRVTKDTIGNFVYQEIITEAEKEVSEGERVSSVLIRHSEIVPPFVTNMIKVGEDTGKIDKTLMEVVNFYQKEIERGVETFMSLIEPILIVFLGGIVALLAVAIFMPLYKMLGSL